MISLKSENYNPAYYFYRLVNNYRLNNKEEAMKWSDLIEYSFEPMPQRYKELALHMKFEMELWKDTKDDLGDISREMKKAEDRLRNGRGGKETQKIQKDVLDRLGKMIKDMEDAKEAAAKAAASAAAPKIVEQPTPAVEAVQPNEMGEGRVDPKRLKEIAEVWGKLPEKERASALRELTRKMPPYDRRVIENYFRELQKRSQK